jgi:hypothetical protein
MKISCIPGSDGRLEAIDVIGLVDDSVLVNAQLIGGSYGG